jgi:hypothetical protein
MKLVALTVIAHRAEQPRQGSLAELGNLHSDSRKPEVACERNVIEAGHCHVLGNSQAPCPHRLESADRHIVVCSEQRIERLAALQQLLYRLLAGSLAEVAVKDFTLQAAFLACLTECGGALIGIDIAVRPGDMDKPPASERREMVDNRANAGSIIEMNPLAATRRRRAY